MVVLIVLLWLGIQCWQHGRSALETLEKKEDAYRLAMAFDEAPGERQAQLAHYIVFSVQAYSDTIGAHIFLAAGALLVALRWHDVVGVAQWIIHEL
jgi:hypothetical protein